MDIELSPELDEVMRHPITKQYNEVSPIHQTHYPTYNHLQMNKEIPIVNRIVHKRNMDRMNGLLLHKINNVKFANFTAFKTKHQIKHNHQQEHDPIKLVPLQEKQKRAKTVMNDPKVREQNKNLYIRLIHQKPTISTKSFNQQRHKNAQYLKRIGRYPYLPNKTMPDQQQQEQHQQLMRVNTFQDIDEVQQQPKGTSYTHTVSAHNIKNVNITSKIEQQQRKQCVILLWSKVVQLNSLTYTVKFIRMKNHYQIQAIPYPAQTTVYFVKLLQEVGTSLLSENDYDYQYIFTNFVNNQHNRLSLSFQLNHGYSTKKCFYTFQQKTPIPSKETPSYRKTNFSIQNELKIDSNIKPSTHQSVPIFKDINTQFVIKNPNRY